MPAEGRRSSELDVRGGGLGWFLQAHWRGSSMGTDGMQAWLWTQYGGPEALRLGQVPKPRPNAHEVLVRVQAVSINAADWHAMRGKPAFARLTYGLVHPKPQSLGVDVAGQVESVGEDVEAVKPGDEVFANLLEHGLGASRNTCASQLRRWRQSPRYLDGGSGGRPHVRRNCSPRARPPGTDRAGTQGPHQRRIGRRRDLCRADRALVRP